MFQNLSRIRDDLSALSFPDVSKQALSKARQFINPSLFKELYYLSVALFYKQIPSRKLWNGYHLFAVDGSRIELPNSQSTFDFFGEMSMFLYISSYPLNVQLHWNISKYWKIWGSIRIALLFWQRLLFWRYVPLLCRTWLFLCPETQRMSQSFKKLLRSCTKKLSGAVRRSFPEDHFQEKNKSQKDVHILEIRKLPCK